MNKIMLASIFLIFIACKNDGGENQEALSLQQGSLNEELVLQHMKAISSDVFQGRMPCTEGGKKTIAYLENALKNMGISPAPNGSYRQDVELADVESFPASYMEMHSDRGNFDLLKSKDYVIHSYRMEEEVVLKNSDLIWCGFGIVAPELGWNDYEGVDMKGKTAVVMINDPDFGMEDDPNPLFQGEAMTYYGRWTYKYEEADRQGADGLLIVHETQSAGYPWFVIQSSWSGPQQGLASVDRSNDCGVKGWISLATAQKLFKKAGMDFSRELRSARKKGFKPRPMYVNANVTMKNEFKKCTSQNVVGYIEGSKYPDEYIVYTAHWDHLGEGNAVDGDSIYNGALDNASGVSALLSIADAFSKPENKPERSVVFLFVTAEEQGLLGSEHYVNNPVFPLEKTVCNINLDGVNPAGPMKDITITGKGYSEMDEYVERLAKKYDRYVMGDQEPEKGYFFRSDHFNFVKNGVPAFYGEGGYDHREKGKAYAKQFKEDYVSKRYHAPSDEFNEEEWDLRGFMEDANLYFDLGKELSNSRDWPQFYEGTGFNRKS